MRYWLNVYRADLVYTVLRFYTAWAESSLSGSARALQTLVADAQAPQYLSRDRVAAQACDMRVASMSVHDRQQSGAQHIAHLGRARTRVKEWTLLHPPLEHAHHLEELSNEGDLAHRRRIRLRVPLHLKLAPAVATLIGALWWAGSSVACLTSPTSSLSSRLRSPIWKFLRLLEIAHEHQFSGMFAG